MRDGSRRQIRNADSAGTAASSKPLPLKARLAATGRLIDLIVYLLSGLAEEEVADRGEAGEVNYRA